MNRRLLFIFAIGALITNCSFQSPERSNPRDPKSPKYVGGGEKEVVKDGLVAWWKFNGDVTASVGTYTSSCTVTAYRPDRFGEPSGAYENNAASCMFGSVTDFDFEPITVEFWMYPTATNVSGNILENGAASSCTAGSSGYNISWGASSGIRASACYGATPYTTSEVAISANAWWHIFLVLDGLNIWLHAYDLSGTPLTQFTTGTGSFSPENTFELRLLYVNAYYDDLRVYNRALSTDEMNQNHEATEH